MNELMNELMNEYTVCMKVLEYQSLHLSSYQHIWVEKFRLFFPSYLCLLSVCLPGILRMPFH